MKDVKSFSLNLSTFNRTASINIIGNLLWSSLDLYFYDFLTLFLTPYFGYKRHCRMMISCLKLSSVQRFDLSAEQCWASKNRTKKALIKITFWSLEVLNRNFWLWNLKCFFIRLEPDPPIFSHCVLAALGMCMAEA